MRPTQTPAEVDGVPSLPFITEAAERAAELRRSGLRVGTMDLRIGATALVRGFTVLTRNTIDFDRFPGLSVEDWTLPG